MDNNYNPNTLNNNNSFNNNMNNGQNMNNMNAVSSMNNMNAGQDMNSMNAGQNMNSMNASQNMNNMNTGQSMNNMNTSTMPNSGVEKPKTNKNAISSLVCSIISLFIFWWLALVGISTGALALREIKQNGGKGKGLAIAGIIIGIISEALYWGFKAISK